MKRVVPGLHSAKKARTGAGEGFHPTNATEAETRAVIRLLAEDASRKRRAG